jgi:hypothetical protein
MFNPLKQTIMETIKKNILKDSEDVFFTHDFGRKFYIKVGETLRACMIDSIIIPSNFFTSAPTSYGERSQSIIYNFKVAGLGIVGIKRYGTISMNFMRTDNEEKIQFYDSVDSFSKKETAAVGHLLPLNVPKLLNCLTRDMDMSKSNEHHYVLFRYRWDGTQAVRVYPLIDKIVITEDKAEISYLYFPENTYRTKEECEKDNKISVIEFD